MAHFRSLLFASLLISCYFAITVEGRGVREKRDVLKGGKDHDLLRSKRYIGRIPVAYMKKVNSLPYSDGEDDGIAKQPISHFREFSQLRQGQGNEEVVRGGPGGMSKTHQASRRYVPFVPPLSSEDPETSSLTDEEIQTLLLMLDGQDVKSPRIPIPQNANLRPDHYYPFLSPLSLDRLAQMYNVGKRETGKRSLRNFEQPMSFDNALYTNGEDNLEFLTPARSKRVGGTGSLKSSRVKKEADSPVNSLIQKEKVKKGVDWSNYFGIDKRANNDKKQPFVTSSKPQPTSSSASNPKPSPTTNAIPIPKSLVAKDVPLSTSTSTKTSKKGEDRMENETVNKGQDADRDWILQEAYRNFAMMTNVKRKREAPSIPSNDLDRLEELEQQMTKVGDKIIWDALKYGGAHRDEEMSQDELGKVKANIINKLSTAYSLEKVREAVDELRQKIAALEKQ